MVAELPSKSDESRNSEVRKARKKERKSRWGSKSIIPGLPTKVPEMNSEQEKIYLLQLQIEQTRTRLRRPDLGISTDPDERSPSPQPIYNYLGQRTNTREMRTRKKLEETLQNSIQELQTLCPSYVPPADCRQTAKYTAKVYIPSEKYPHINFVGLCIGPRGYTLKEMEEESGAKIIIRGRGSVKEGKLGGQEMMLPGSDEPLHAYITANHHDSIAKAQTRINRIIEEAVDSPEGENTLRSKQMNQLAVLNGTVSTNTDMLSKIKQISDSKEIFTNCLVCTICGAKGHLTQDCKFKDDTTELNNSGIDPSQLNSEYMSLMRELKVNESDIDPNKPSIQGQITNDVTVCNWQDLFAITPDMAAGFGMMQMPTAALESSMNLQQNPATLPSGNNHQFNA